MGGAVRADRAVLSEAGQRPPAGRRFVGIDLGREPVPDETTVCRFRHLLEEHDLGRQLFDEVGLGDGGVLLGPVVTAPGQDLHSAGVEPSVHAISIEFDLVQPVGAFGAFFTSAASCGLTHLGRPGEWPPNVLFIDFAITAAREVLSSTRVQRPRRIDMPRASWRGYLRLSLVSCPIYLSPATARTKPIRLHQVWRATPADEAGEVSDQEVGQDVPERPGSRFTPDYVEDQPERARPATRITLRPHDPSTGEEVEKEDVVRGYEYQRGHYVTFTAGRVEGARFGKFQGHRPGDVYPSRRSRPRLLQ